MSSFYKIQDEVASAASLYNEDVIAYKGSDQSLDIWVIDGATSIADQEYLGQPASDPAWFAQTISDQFKKRTDSAVSPPSVVSASVREVTAQYESLTQNQEIPLFAKPLAALVWVRAYQKGGKTAFQFWSLGDCRVLIGSENAAPLLFPPLARGDIAPHAAPPSAAGAEPEARTRAGVLASHAFQERKIREEKHTDPAKARLGFHPDSILYATTHVAAVKGPCTLLAMSDGFYRLVDEYGLYADESLLAACSKRGLAALLKELRHYEQTRDMSQAVKKSDDATAILIQFTEQSL